MVNTRCISVQANVSLQAYSSNIKSNSGNLVDYYIYALINGGLHVEYVLWTLEFIPPYDSCVYITLALNLHLNFYTHLLS